MDILPLDLNFQDLPQTVAAYLLRGPDGLLLVESGPASTLPRLREALAQQGVSPADLDGVLLTHIHLDHAGAAGWLAREGVPLYVHRVGAPHLIDPDRLLSSASRIYGERMDPLWGETVSAPADKVTAVSDGDVLRLAGLEITALDTPGHAWHHHSYRIGDIAFTGDALGIRLPGKDLVDLPAPPPEFKYEVWLGTLDRLGAEKLAAIYPTHYGRVDDVDGQIDGLRDLMGAAIEFVRLRLEDEMPRDQIVREYVDWNKERARSAGLSDYTIRQYDAANPLYMSVDGITRYWQRKWAKEQGA